MTPLSVNLPLSALEEARAENRQLGSALALLCGGNVTLKRLQGLHIEAAR